MGNPQQIPCTVARHWPVSRPFSRLRASARNRSSGGADEEGEDILTQICKKKRGSGGDLHAVPWDLNWRITLVTLDRRWRLTNQPVSQPTSQPTCQHITRPTQRLICQCQCLQGAPDEAIRCDDCHRVPEVLSRGRVD